MNGRERVMRAIEFAGPDRVPIVHYPSRAALSKYGTRLTDILERYPEDFSISHYDFPAEQGTYRVGRYRDRWGVVWENIFEGLTGISKGHPLENWDAFEDYEFPDPLDDSIFNIVEEKMGEVGHQGYMSFGHLGLFEKMQQLRGFNNLMTDMLLHKDRFHELVRGLTDYNLQRIRRWAETELDQILIGDDWGTQRGPMISPKLWVELFQPYYKEMCDAIHEAGKSVQLHSDGHILELVPHIIDCGFDLIHCQVKLMGMEEVSKRFGGKICFRADLDRQGILPFGTPEEVTEHVKEVIRNFAVFNGGLIGYGMMNPDVPLANIEAMWEAFRKYGEYPIKTS